MRRLTALWLLVLLALPAVASAGAGGGTSGFGGGGGGGGGGFSGGGGGIGGGGGAAAGGASFVGFFGLIAVVLVVLLLSWLNRQRMGAAYRRRRGERAHAVRLAAAEAAEDDAWFDPDAVRTESEALFRRVQDAWTRQDERALGELLDRDLLVEWRRRIADFRRRGWVNHVTIAGEVDVEYLGLVNRDDDDEDRVSVRITATLQDVTVDRMGRRLTRDDAGGSDVKTVSEWWVLRRAAERWRLESIEQDAEGRHILDEPLVASPWSDEAGLRDEALLEGAAADAVPEGVAIAEVADLDFEGEARAAAMDLSLADGRFSPDVIEVAVRRAASGWATAVDGDDARLEAVARPEAVRSLLRPQGEGTRLVVRGPRVTRMTVAGLDAGAQPPTVTVELQLAGRRYVENRDTLERLSGDPARERTWAETWVLALDGDAANPWRVARTSATPRAATA
jgi:predicted lipid-binding transport protein (Tim44 family)